MTLIRTFVWPDYDAVLALWREAGLTIKPSDSREEIAKLNLDLFLVAEIDKAIAGAVIGAWDGRRAWIYHLAVKPALQGQGIGKQLLREVESRLTALGATKVNLLVEPSNDAAGAFYRAVGYPDQPLQFFTRHLK